MSVYKSADLLEFCDICFRQGKPNLCETYRGTFTKINSIHFSQQAKLDRIVNKLEVTPKMIDRRWACTFDDLSKRKEFVDSLWGIGVSVHTLDDHAKMLTKLYRPEVRKSGNPVTINLPNSDTWEQFDPKTRQWKELQVITKNDEIVASADLGNILKCTSIDGASYYRSNKTDDHVTLIPMEKRAALNIMSTIAEPFNAQWKSDESGNKCIIEYKEIPNMPDEIFNFLKRLGTKSKKIPDALIFENNDFDLVRDVLSCIKINLVKSSEIVSGLSETKSGSSIAIEKITKERLQVLIDIIKDMNGMIDIKEDHIIVSGTRGQAILTFVDDDKSSQEGNVIRISMSALEDPARISEIFFLIKKRLGLLELPLESTISQHWPILNETDLQYVVQSAISWYSSNPVLATKIISEYGKLDKVKEWNKKIKEGKVRSNLDTVTLGKIIKRLESP